MSWLRACLCLLLAFATPAAAQTFPALNARVVDVAEVLPPDREAALTAKLEALERQNGRQFVIATVPSLEGFTIEDYGYRLGRHWAIGRKKIDDGLILLVAPIEREVRIEVGYGLTPIVTDAVSKLIIENDILPKFRENDLPGGIEAGADRLIDIVSLPNAQAEARAQKFIDESKSPLWLIIVAVLFMGSLILVFIGYWLWVLWMTITGIIDFFRRLFRGERVFTWTSSSGSSSPNSSSSSWSSSSSSGSFSGGGGSFGGGGASGSW